MGVHCLTPSCVERLNLRMSLMRPRVPCSLPGYLSRSMQTTFLRESIFLASCAQMVSVSGDIAEEEERLLLELAHTPSQRDIRMKRKSILLEGGLHMGNHDLESTVGTSTAIGGYQDADADRVLSISSFLSPSPSLSIKCPFSCGSLWLWGPFFSYT